MDGIGSIAAERQRQVKAEGWTPSHDDEHYDYSLATVAALYASPDPLFFVRSEVYDGKCYKMTAEDPWPESWSRAWDKRGSHNRRKQLVIAGALIAAEIDRLDRLHQKPST